MPTNPSNPDSPGSGGYRTPTSRTPTGSRRSPRTPAGASSSSSLPATPTSQRSPLQLPAGFSPRNAKALVYARTDATKVDADPTRRQGVWKDGYDLVVSPSELWMFTAEDAPAGGLERASHAFGAWAIDPRVCPNQEATPSLDDLKALEEIDALWFFGPKSRIPRDVKPRGVWTFPQVNIDTTSLTPNSSGLLHLTDSAKQNKLDVGGSWKLLYRRDGLPDDLPLGPGISPRKSKTRQSNKRPTTMTLVCRGPGGGEGIPIPGLLPTDPLSTLRARIHELEGTLPEHQRVRSPTRGSGLLSREDDPQSLSELGWEDGDDVVLEGITVHVETPKGRRLTIPGLGPNTDTVGDLKDKIAAHPESVPRDQQRLVYRRKPLNDDDATLADHRLRHESVVVLEPATIVVRTPDGTNIPLAVDPLEDTLSDLRELVEDKTGIPPDQQHYHQNGTALPDSGNDTHPLADLGIGHGDVLDLEPTRITVRLPDGRSVPLRVGPTDTLAETLDRLAPTAGIPSHDLALARDGRPLSDDPSATLADLGIGHGDVLDATNTAASGPMTILVRDKKGRTTPLDVDASDTIGSVKDRLAGLKDLRPAAQVLDFEGTRLNDDAATLADCGLKDGSVLDLDRFRVFVESPGHGRFAMDAEPHWKIKRLLQSAEARFGISPDRAEPSFRGAPLSDPTAKLSDCGIGHKDTVVVGETEVPEYDVHMSAWQDPFSYKPKAAYVKKHGVRRKTTHDRSKDFYGPGTGKTALTIDIWDHQI